MNRKKIYTRLILNINRYYNNTKTKGRKILNNYIRISMKMFTQKNLQKLINYLLISSYIKVVITEFPRKITKLKDKLLSGKKNYWVARKITESQNILKKSYYAD